MKKLQLFFVILSAIIVTSCEKVIDVDLNTMAPKLVIDASIKWQKGTLGNEQTVKLSTTTSYYSTQIPTVSGATIFITDAANNVFNFVETAGTGSYNCTDFTPVLNGNYELTVLLNGETYTATET